MQGSRELRARILIGSLVAGVLVAGWLAWRRQERASGTVSIEQVLADAELRRAVVERAAAATTGRFDSHPDPDVGRVLLSAVERPETAETTWRANAMGLRERDYALPKPPGTVRIVLLGDSLVYGLYCAADQRMGCWLERFLGERLLRPAVRFEVLHIAVPSWNIRSECAFLRRQLHELAPDLVFQFTFQNDLADVGGVRGFGSEASFSPAWSQHADAMIARSARAETFEPGTFLAWGWGHESRTRFESARAAILALRAGLARSAGHPRHVLIGDWGPLDCELEQWIGSALEPDSVLYLPRAFRSDPATKVAQDDVHWNPSGHEIVGRLLYGLIRTRGLLPAVELAPWPEAEELARRFAREGLAEAHAVPAALERARQKMLPALDTRTAEGRASLQIFAGIDAQGLASPYVSVLLGPPASAHALVVRGRALPDEVLDGTRVEVWVEEHELASLELHPDQPVEYAAELPAELRGDAPLNVRLIAADYVYRGDDLRHCVVFRLEKIALE